MPKKKNTKKKPKNNSFRNLTKKQQTQKSQRIMKSLMNQIVKSIKKQHEMALKATKCRNTKDTKCLTRVRKIKQPVGKKRTIYLLSKAKGNTCCPHMSVDSKKRYAKTGTDHTMIFKNRKYKFRTCCKACGVEMKKLLRKDPKKFEELYIYSDHYHTLILKHKDTGIPVQIATKV